ncbi:Protein of unknown function [Pyronema omphalodes CBS 100304]|uniref:Uncharacterized protein n=1 Tax=Pyronema omphalodes (strain CBS 100304) TaxID=1076935 RepID=U4LMX9_PYROM|nr:Protein of unknown function [Pyronema omphalodes CBS 100304]
MSQFGFLEFSVAALRAQTWRWMNVILGRMKDVAWWGFVGLPRWRWRIIPHAQCVRIASEHSPVVIHI